MSVGYGRLHDAVALGIERDGADRRPVAGMPCPAPRMALLALHVELMPTGQDRLIDSEVPIRRTDISDSAVPVLMVVPMHEPRGPVSGDLQ